MFVVVKGSSIDQVKIQMLNVYADEVGITTSHSHHARSSVPLLPTFVKNRTDGPKKKGWC